MNKGKKVRVFRKGGKLYCMRGGKIIPLAQAGLNMGEFDFANQYGNMNLTVPPAKYPDDASKKFDVGDVANIGMAATSLINNATQKEYNPSNRYTASATKGYNDDSFNQGLNTMISAIPGVGQAANAIKAVGQGISNIVKNKDEHGISKTGAGEVVGNIFNPGEWIGQSIQTGKKYGTGEGFKNFLTFGTSGRNLMKDAVENAEDQNDFMQSRMAKNQNEGNYRNDSIYAQMGGTIKMHPKQGSMYDEPNVEIEGGEILLGNPSNVKYFGNANTENASNFAVKFNGDKHGQDSDGDGMEGIPLKAESGTYIASDYLGVNGKKKSKNNPSVADEMEASVAYLANTEEDSQDKYKNNPMAMKHHLNNIKNIKSDAEKGKFMEELQKMLKSKKRNVKDILSFIQQNAPMEDLNPEEAQMVNSLGGGQQVDQAQAQMQPQMGMRYGGKMPRNRMYQMGGEYDEFDAIMEQDMRDRARNVMGVPGADQATYERVPEEGEYDQSYKDYDVRDEIVDQRLSGADATPSITVKDKNVVRDYRENPGESQQTLKSLAGKSKLTGIDNYLPSKVDEMLPGVLKIFDDTAAQGDPEDVFQEEFVQTLVNDYGIPEEEVRATRLNSIQDGAVGDVIGQMLQDAYGVRSSENYRGGDAASAGSGTQRMQTDNKFQWVNSLVQQAMDNVDGNGNPMLPANADISDELRDQVLTAAKQGLDQGVTDTKGLYDITSGMGWGQALSRDYNKAVRESAREETDRQASATFEVDNVQADRIDVSTDLAENPVDGRILSWGEAFRYAQDTGMPTFTYKGKSYLAKRESELTDEERAGLARAAEMGWANETAPSNQITATPMEVQRGVNNTKRRVTAIEKNGGSIYQEGGMVDPQMQGQQEQPNPSQDRMEDLVGQAQDSFDPQVMNANMDQLSPQAQQMLQQLPPEMQEQIMQLPVEQMEIAIINAFQQMQGGQQGAPQDMGQGQAPMDPGMQSQVPQDVMMKFGGTLTDGYKSTQRSTSEANKRSAHLPRPAYTNKENTIGTHQKLQHEIMGMFKNGGTYNPVQQLTNQYTQRGYHKDTAMEMAKNKMNEYQRGGMTYGEMQLQKLRPGMKVKFKKGGKVVSGVIDGIDTRTGYIKLR